MTLQNAKGVPLNCGTLTTNPSYIFQKPPIRSNRFRLKASSTVSTGSGNVITQQDALIEQNINIGNTLTDFNISVEGLTPDSVSNVLISSTNTSVILSPDSSGVARGISAGSASLIGTSSAGDFSIVDVVVSGVAGSSTSNFSGYVAGSLAKNASDAVSSNIATKMSNLNGDVELIKPVFSTQNHTTATYVRNSNCWASNFDLTCISPWNSAHGNLRVGTLISPRHIIFAAHYQINNGATIRFVDNNNNVVERTMVTKLTHPNYQTNFFSLFYLPIRDFTIGVLDSDVPETIKFAKILPSNWHEYLPNIPDVDFGACGVNYNSLVPVNIRPTVPVLVLDQTKKALVVELEYMSMLDTIFGDICHTGSTFVKPIGSFIASPFPNDRLITENRRQFYKAFVVGDSGNPMFLIINNELVIVSVATTSGDQHSNLCVQKSILNNMMNQLGGGYQLTEVDLSGFTNYNSV